MTSAFLRANFLTQQKEILNALVPCCHLCYAMTIRFLYNNNGARRRCACGGNKHAKQRIFPLLFRGFSATFWKGRGIQDFFDAILAFTISHLPLKMWTAFLNEWSWSSNRCVFCTRSWINVHSICTFEGAGGLLRFDTTFKWVLIVSSLTRILKFRIHNGVNGLMPQCLKVCWESRKITKNCKYKINLSKTLLATLDKLCFLGVFKKSVLDDELKL